MTDLIKRLREASAGTEEWRVLSEGGGIVMWYSRRGQDAVLNPEREAREWLRKHQADGYSLGHRVERAVSQSQDQRLMAEAADALEALAAERDNSETMTAESHGGIQAGLDNDKLREAWDRKLPGVEPTDRQMTAFALGVEVGFEHARNLERQDWSRVHHVLAKAGVHPGRTDDHLADVIDRALRSRA